MKVKTSVTLSEDVLKTIDRSARKGESRSQHIERLLREGLQRRARHAADARDRDIIDRHADALNAEGADAVSYQTDL
jgi:metal-responsive CopG/Arc/MetJ family transcriptional regulator